jgi:hypothetical protein
VGIIISRDFIEWKKENGKRMNRNELEQFLSEMESIGFKPVIITIEGDNEDVEKYRDPEEALGAYAGVGSKETLRPITITKVDFNKACDTVIFNNDFDIDDIFLLANFTSKVRTLLFDKDKKTEKEEKKNV